jgi:hypothetical protein
VGIFELTPLLADNALPAVDYMLNAKCGCANDAVPVLVLVEGSPALPVSFAGA